MFREAYEQARKFTFPAIDYYLTGDGKCGAGPAAFVVVNSEGWIVTAAHVMKQSIALAKSDHDAREWEHLRDAIRDETTLSAKERSRRQDANGRFNKKAVRRGGTSWGFLGANIQDRVIAESW